ncbi:hypothetical protein L5515_010087 [Caenorhabditis briggsae]|uniref:Uncharacterized protein n=1 Tax=Caenorhabditis briggsae TaxID=6238 RepID=A0AAE9EQ68_CAEBR|nr:hypothetical protein L5515_010087 [Caenorhabditis briggsae]
MKGHISIGILLLFCAYGALGASILAKRDEAEKKQFVTGLNRLRQVVAAEFKIANMQEMSYHTGLENEDGRLR